MTKTPEITCKFCSKYYHLSVEGRLNTSILRACTEGRRSVTVDSKRCSRFELTPYFYCNKNHQWVYVVACRSRIEKKYEGCGRCKTGKLIKELRKERSFNGNLTLIKRRKEKELCQQEA